MNIPYVTKKATRPKPWQGAILGICGFLTIVLATMVPEYVTTKGAIDNGVLFALLLGCVTPIYMVIREAWRCSTAKRIGNWFAYYRETSVTFDKLSREINKHAVQSIDGLLKLGYLQNLSELRRKEYGCSGKSQQMPLLRSAAADEISIP